MAPIVSQARHFYPSVFDSSTRSPLALLTNKILVSHKLKRPSLNDIQAFLSIFIVQNHHTQYDECDCNATGVENPNCDPDITTRQICQDEVIIEITFDSKDNPSALSFEPDTTYYLISKFDKLGYHCTF